MNDQDQKAYLDSRRQAELQKAKEAGDPVVEGVHRRMAELYEKQIRDLDGDTPATE